MRKFVLQVLIFFALFLLANVAYLELVKKLDWNFKKVLEAQNMSSKEFDILILGNSLAMDGINSKMLGNAYNLSIGGATLNTNEKQLKQYFESCQKLPKTVILGMASCIDEDYKRQGIHPIIRYLDSNKFDSFYDLPMIQFKWMSQVLLKKLLSKEHREATLVQGQLRIKRVKADKSVLTSNMDSTLDRAYYRELNVLSRIDSLCQANKSELIVIEMPGIKKTQNAIPIGPYSLGSYKLYNFNNQLFCTSFDSEKHWLGGSHLNEEGANVFTAALKNFIEAER